MTSSPTTPSPDATQASPAPAPQAADPQATDPQAAAAPGTDPAARPPRPPKPPLLERFPHYASLPMFELEYPPIEKEDLYRSKLSQAIIADMRAGDDDTNGRLFVVIMPLGLPHRDTIRQALADMGITVEGVLTLGGFPDTSVTLYAREPNTRGVERAWVYERAWKALGPDLGSEGELWWVSPREKHEELSKMKHELRKRTPSLEFLVKVDDDHKHASLHGVHVPDEGRLLREVARLVRAGVIPGELAPPGAQRIDSGPLPPVWYPSPPPEEPAATGAAPTPSEGAAASAAPAAGEGAAASEGAAAPTAGAAPTASEGKAPAAEGSEAKPA